MTGREKRYRLERAFFVLQTFMNRRPLAIRRDCRCRLQTHRLSQYHSPPWLQVSTLNDSSLTSLERSSRSPAESATGEPARTKRGLLLPSGDMVRDVLGWAVHQREFIEICCPRVRQRKCQSIFTSFMIHKAFPTLTETAFGSHPYCVVSVTYVTTHCFHRGNRDFHL